MGRSVLLTVAVLLLMTVPAFAGIVFDFEDEALTSAGIVVPYSPPGDLTALSITESGLTMQLRRESGRPFDIVDLSSYTPGSWGARSLDPFSFLFSSWFIAEFDAVLASVTIDMGDFGTSDNDTLVLQGWSEPDGTGTLLATASVAHVDGGQPFPNPMDVSQVSISSPGIRSIRFRGGSGPYPQSMFMDNIDVELQDSGSSAPEPGTVLLFGLGLAGLFLVRRRRGR